MPFQDMSDEDLTAVISYLRSQEPVKHVVEHSQNTRFWEKYYPLLGWYHQCNQRVPPPKSVTIDATAEYGAYLATQSCLTVLAAIRKGIKKPVNQSALPSAGGWHLPPDSQSKGIFICHPQPNA